MSSTPVLKLGDEEFDLRRVDTSWGAMRFQAVREKALKQRPHPAEMDKERFGKDCDKCVKVMAESEAAGGELLGVMYKMLMTVIHPDSRAEFIDFMDDPDGGGNLEPGALEEAIGTAMAAIGGEAEVTGGDSEDDTEGKEPGEPSSTSST